MRNLILTGFMGTGKTTVGRLAARRLGMPFVDTDDEIVRRAGLSISEIFARYGETEFRKLEREICCAFAAENGRVLATGGGALINPANRTAVADGNLLVCLIAATDTIRTRLANPSGRPLAKDWETLYEQRRAAYAEIPNQVDTTRKSPEQVVEEVIQLWTASQSQ